MSPAELGKLDTDTLENIILCMAPECGEGFVNFGVTNRSYNVLWSLRRRCLARKRLGQIVHQMDEARDRLVDEFEESVRSRQASELRIAIVKELSSIFFRTLADLDSLLRSL